MFTQVNINPNNDIEVLPPPNDTVSALSWNPKANFLMATSWDNTVRIWEIQQNGSATPKMQVNHEAPPLCCTWSGDGTKFFTGGCDNKVICWDPQVGQSSQVAQHQAPVKFVAWLEERRILATASWDKTLKYWDGRSANPVLVVTLPERCYAADFIFPLAVVATAERHVCIYDLNKPDQPYRTIQSPLKYQSRCLACFPDKTGFALGSIEGRVAIQYVNDSDSGKNFAFKCHRENDDVYAVNGIAFHRGFGTFATCGSDGTCHFWDKDSRMRLKAFTKCSLPVTACAFNAFGNIFAYSLGYDWSKGAEFFNPTTMKPHVYVHAVSENEIKNRSSHNNNNQRRR
jgi:mRNA export factor